MLRNFAITLSVGALLVSAPVWSKEKAPELSGLALQQIQSKDYETTADIVFPSVVTILQDSGYRITEADKTSGFVSGVGSAEAKTTYNIWWGLGKKKTIPMVSVFVEQRGPSITRVRMNFVLSKAKTRSAYTDETPITDTAVYRDAFEKLEKEIFIRQSMNAPTQPKTN